MIDDNLLRKDASCATALNASGALGELLAFMGRDTNPIYSRTRPRACQVACMTHSRKERRGNDRGTCLNGGNAISCNCTGAAMNLLRIGFSIFDPEESLLRGVFGGTKTLRKIRAWHSS
jgi:hypothetical protein